MLPAHCTTTTDHLLAPYRSDTPETRYPVSEPHVSELAAAVRPGWTVAPRQAAFVRAVEDLADEHQVRCDGRRNLLAIAWVYARRTGRPPERAMVTSPSRTLVMQLTGLSDATVKRWTCWMVRRGVMAQLEVGRLARFRPMAVQDEGGRVSVYVLCTPGVTVAAEPAAAVVEVLVDDVPAANGEAHPASPVDKSDPSGCLGFVLRENPYPGARANGPAAAVLGFRAGEERSDKRGSGPWPRCAVAGSRSDRLSLVERLQAEAPALRPASARQLRSVLLPWLVRPELGWTVAELLYAIDHTPDGRAHTFTGAVKIPHKWLAHRMRAWLDERDQPLPAPAVAAAAARAAKQAEAAQARAERRDQVRRIAADHAFGDMVRDVAGARYPALVDVVLTRHAGAGAARLMPAAAAEAMTRAVVRETAGPALSREMVAAAVEALLHVNT